MSALLYGPDTTSAVDAIAVERTVRVAIINPEITHGIAEGVMSVLDAKGLRSALDEAIWQAENYAQPTGADVYGERQAS